MVLLLTEPQLSFLLHMASVDRFVCNPYDYMSFLKLKSYPHALEKFKELGIRIEHGSLEPIGKLVKDRGKYRICFTFTRKEQALLRDMLFRLKEARKYEPRPTGADTMDRQVHAEEDTKGRKHMDSSERSEEHTRPRGDE